MSDKKKPLLERIKDSKFAEFVRDKVAPVAGDVIGIIGDVTGIEAIERVGGLLNKRKEDNEQIRALDIEFQKYRMQWELEVSRAEMAYELEMLRAEVADRDSARAMRSEFTKQGKIDWEHLLINFIAIVAFFGVVWFLLFYTVPEQNREFIIHILGIFEGIVVGIYMFHNGSSSGSRRKTEIIDRSKNEAA